ncbi:MAG: extracellular solute-binding protein [Chloroflexi bacterium]|nr:extracellular solute-binding protein [Chloroflexota bacterium]
MNQSLWILLVFLSFSLVYGGCSQVGPSSPPPIAKAPAVESAQPVPGASWQRNWESTVAQAKKEGLVRAYTIVAPEARIALAEAFKERFGIEVEFMPFGRAAELMTKVQAEKTAGLYLADIFFAGVSTATTQMKPAGLLGPLEVLFMLPEATDPSGWIDGKFPYADQDRRVIAFSGRVARDLFYNTDLIRKGEIASYKDLLNPQYKGKITLNDPTLGGSGAQVMATLALRSWSIEEVSAFLTQLIEQQQAFIQRDNRLQVESVARGKYAIGIGAPSEMLPQFLKAGAPLEIVMVKEGSLVSAGNGAFSVPTKLAHPNAARVFANWLLTREGQTAFARGSGLPSRRTDISTEGTSPIFLPRPGEKLFFDDEEMIIFRTGKMMDVTKQIIDRATKK